MTFAAVPSQDGGFIGIWRRQMKITPDTRLKDIYGLNEFAGFAQYVIWGANDDITLRDLNRRSPDWIAQDMADGFQHLLDTGARFTRLYSDAERSADPALDKVMLFEFTLDKPAPFVVLCAGGAYMGVASMVEAFPSAKRFNELGYAAFVLQYRAGDDGGREKPLDDLARAVKYVLDNAERLSVIEKGYAVGGFSAGGHLAAAFGTEQLGWGKYGLPSPAAILLSYPVITMGPGGHEGSRRNFLHEKFDEPDAWKRYSPEILATEAYPPSYIWCCEKDREVTPEYNALNMEKRLRCLGVRCMCEVFPGNSHGWGRAGGTPADKWIEHAVKFWESAR